MGTLMELHVSLDFACCGCGRPVRVTVQYTGDGLGTRPLARVQVPCPCGCGTVNQLEFEPSGTIRAVTPYTTPRPLLEPSIN